MAERIRIEKLPSCTYKIRGEKHDFGWADITIRQWDKGGSISVQSDFGSFNGFWNAIGERDFRAFLASLDYGYFMEKTLPPVSFNIRAGYRFSFEQSKNALREQILLLRRDGDLGRRHARSCWNEVTHFFDDEPYDDRDFIERVLSFPCLDNFVHHGDIDSIPIRAERDPSCSQFWEKVWSLIRRYWRAELEVEAA